MNGFVPAPSRTFRVHQHGTPDDRRLGPFRLVGQTPLRPGQIDCFGEMASKASGETLDYSWDFSMCLDDTADAIVGVPDVKILTGTGDEFDLAVFDASVSAGSLVTAMFCSGHAGIRERVSVSVRTEQGRVFGVVCSLFINPCSPSVAAIQGTLILWGGVAAGVGDQLITV